MAISFIAANTGNASSTSASCTPTGEALAANDVCVVFGYQRGTTTTLSVAASGLTFNQVVAPSGSATNGSFGAWWARYPNTTNPQITVTGSSTTNLSIGIIVVVLRGVDTSSTPTTNVGSITDQASSSLYSVTGPTGLSSGVAMVGLGGSMDNNNPVGSWSGAGYQLANYGNDISAGTDAAQSMVIELESGGTAGNFSYTLGANGPDLGRTLIFGLKPAADAVVEIWNGTSWRTDFEIWNGTSWRTDAEIYNGTSWKLM